MKFRWWILLIALGSLAGTVFIYPQLPETVATHWDAAGQVNGTGPRSVQLLLGALKLLGGHIQACLKVRTHFSLHASHKSKQQMSTDSLLIQISTGATKNSQQRKHIQYRYKALRTVQQKQQQAR